MSGDQMFCMGLLAGWLIGWFLNRKQPIIKNAKIEAKLVVDEKFVNQIEAAQVMAWLERRNLVWQPKGAVFDPKRTVKK